MLPVTAARSFFAAEADMLAPLAEAASELAGICVEVVFEVAGTAGVPDLVLVQPDLDAIAMRGDADMLTQPVEVAVMLALSSDEHVGRRGLAAEELADRVGVSTRHLASRVLSGMADRGHLRNEGKEWASTYQFRSVAKRLITIEAKLRDWRRGFAQATRHSAGADAAWLAVDATAKDAAMRGRHWFEAGGIGLATVSLGGQVEAVLTPTRTRQYVGRRELLAERAVDVLLSGRPSAGVPHVFGRPRLATTGPDPRLAGATERSCSRASCLH